MSGIPTITIFRFQDPSAVAIERELDELERRLEQVTVDDDTKLDHYATSAPMCVCVNGAEWDVIRNKPLHNQNNGHSSPQMGGLDPMSSDEEGDEDIRRDAAQLQRTIERGNAELSASSSVDDNQTQDPKQQLCDFVSKPLKVIKAIAKQQGKTKEQVIHEFISKIDESEEIPLGFITLLGHYLKEYACSEIPKILRILPEKHIERILQDWCMSYSDYITRPDTISQETLFQYFYDPANLKTGLLIAKIVSFLRPSKSAKLLSVSSAYDGVMYKKIVNKSVFTNICEIYFQKLYACLKAKEMHEIEQSLRFYFSHEICDRLLLLFSDIKQCIPDATDEYATSFALVVKRYNQLCQLSGENEFEGNKIASNELLHLAMYIELHLKKEQGVGHRVLLRSETRLSRLLQVDWQNRMVYISTNKKYSTLQGAGTSKRIISVARIYFDNFNPMNKFFARGFTQLNRDDLRRNPPQFKDYKETVTSTRKELQIAQQLQGDSFNKIYSVAEYNTVHKVGTTKQPFSRISFITDKGSSLDRERTETYTIQEKLQIAFDIISAIAYMHARKLIHGDLKPSNILISDQKRGKLIDFGFTDPVSAYSQCKHALYPYGYYGTVSWTAPELFGVHFFRGDHFKVEAFALGVILYQILYKSYPDWCDMIRTCGYSHTSRPLYGYSNIDPVRNTPLQKSTYTYSQIVQDCVKEFNTRAKPFQDKYDALNAKVKANIPIEKKELCTPEEIYQLLMHKFLCVDPEKRMSAQEALDILANTKVYKVI